MENCCSMSACGSSTVCHFAKQNFVDRFEYLEQCVATTQRQFAQQRLLLEVFTFAIVHWPMTKPFSQVHHQMLKRMVRSSALAIVPPQPDQNIAQGSVNQRRRREGDSAGRSARHDMVIVIVINIVHPPWTSTIPIHYIFSRRTAATSACLKRTQPAPPSHPQRLPWWSTTWWRTTWIRLLGRMIYKIIQVGPDGAQHPPAQRLSWGDLRSTGWQHHIYEIPFCKTFSLLPCQSFSSCRSQVNFPQVTSFSDHEEREEPASQSEIVVEAEVNFSLLGLQNVKIQSQTLQILADIDRFF